MAFLLRTSENLLATCWPAGKRKLQRVLKNKEKLRENKILLKRRLIYLIIKFKYQKRCLFFERMNVRVFIMMKSSCYVVASVY